MSLHGIGFNDVYGSVWVITDAINTCPKLNFEFPTYHEKQKEIVAGFKQKSGVDFDNCAGCIDGMLIWISKPSKYILDKPMYNTETCC